MGSGPLPPNPAELLDSEQMQQLLRDMSGQFDQVIIDGPPSMVVTDASILAGLSDGVVFVVRAGDNTYGLVQRCRDNLERVGAHILGAVLNGVRVSAGGYLRRNYTTFYDYHAQGKLPSKSS
jgi:capsular exopolysaccharide synthesis family protein